MRINPTTNDDSIEKFPSFIESCPTKNNKCEPVYVNSDVDNTYLKIFFNEVHLSKDGIRLSIKVLWNILKDDRQTEDWIGYYRLGLY